MCTQDLKRNASARRVCGFNWRWEVVQRMMTPTVDVHRSGVGVCLNELEGFSWYPIENK